jgi:adenylosuccinate synthase
MKADIVLGIQWGDEGKGRVVDSYCSDYDVVARFGGGDNAGHTLVVGDRKLALRIVPSGVLQERPELFIGGGTVVSLDGLVAELEMLAGIGVDISRIKISDRAHVVFPYHAALDKANEKARGDAAIGTTGRGIGPAYTDKVARSGITFGELHKREALADKIRYNLLARSSIFAAMESAPREEDVVGRTLGLLPRILPHVVDGVDYVHAALESGKRILIEGAQGTLLDIGYGTYPYVTSSHTIAGGACTGLGIGPTAIGRVVGIAKAYCTRVGAGPFPSELLDDVGDALRERGGEFGTVTGRPRRCGWFDAVAAHYAVRLNGLTSAVITKLDVLSGLERVAIVSGYRSAGHRVGFDLSAIRRIADLPPAARRYVDALEAALHVPIEAVSLGPERASLAVR